jgi:4'-phosphopantetheinyl transferase
MIDLWYLNTKNVREEDVITLQKILPQKMINEIIRFRNHEDRRLKLFGKLMVKKYYENKRLEFQWSEWHLSAEGKPYYNNGNKKFSISHSGNYVIVAFSDQETGADIERLANFDIMSVLSYLHPKEKEYIENASDSENAFFKIWTRKEAYLKAIGKGIIDGLNNENCLQDQLTQKEKWYLHSISIISNYQIALCTKIPNCQINIHELFPVEFNNLNNFYMR